MFGGRSAAWTAQVRQLAMNARGNQKLAEVISPNRFNSLAEGATRNSIINCSEKQQARRVLEMACVPIIFDFVRA